MSQFWIYFQIGLKHVLDINAYDHVLFLIALTVPYLFKDWKRIFLLVSLFTIGHTLALILSVYGIIAIKVNIVEFLIPITILVTALYHLFTAGKTSKNDGVNLVFFITLFFGIIHGLGFSNYFKTILGGSATSKLLPLGEFALGIEVCSTSSSFCCSGNFIYSADCFSFFKTRLGTCNVGFYYWSCNSDDY